MPGIKITITTNFNGVDVADLLGAQHLKLAAETGLALLKRRITLHHKRADGAPLSPYGTRPTSVAAAGAATGNPAVRPRGGVRSKSGKSMRFAGGYRQYRAMAGRTTKKDFTLSGNVVGKRMRVLRAQAGVAIVGWPAGSTQGIVAHGLNAQEDGKAFLWSNNEQEAVRRAAGYFIALYMARQGWTDTPPPLNVQDLDK